MPLPFLLPLILGGASAGMSLFGANKAAKASEKAAAQQAQSAREALALQGQMYQQTRSDLAPYRQEGAQGLTALTALLGLPPTGASGAAPGVLSPAPTAPTSLGPPLPGQYGPPGSLSGSMVMLRAPNGQTKAVPASQVDYYLARGATRG